MSVISFRDSLSDRRSIIKARESVKSYINLEQDNEINNERLWRWSVIKTQFQGKDLEKLFILYKRKISQAYFSLFLISQFCLSFTYFLLFLCVNDIKNTINLVVPELIFEALLFILSFIGLFVLEKYIIKHYYLLKVFSGFAFIIILLFNIFMPIYHSEDHLRPTYTVHLIISCYIFFDFHKTFISCLLALFTSVIDICILAFFTYRNCESYYYRLTADSVYLLCINVFGIYFRVINEIIMRKSFLDRRDCIETTLQHTFEKNQEEQLLLTIIPEVFLKEVRETIYDNIKQIIKTNTMPKENLYLKSYDNVTILYADIVNYTMMTSKLSVTNLVETLNELFGKFDDASERFNVLRIKFLGDCYYCVSGLLPDQKKAHAEACVDLGLKMISIIKTVRENRKLDIDMRIGVHTGNIVGGLLGLMKWQFDIWSKDVHIANIMETTGKAGKVHITKQTKDQLNKEYSIEKSYSNHPVLKKYGIETFLVAPRENENYEHFAIKNRQINKQLSVLSENEIIKEDNTLQNNQLYQRRESKPITNTYLSRRISGNPNRSKMSERRSTSDFKRRTAFMDNTINKYHERIKETEEKIINEIKAMPLSKYDQWFKVKNIQPFLVVFKNFELELEYIKEEDFLFKYYILGEILILTSVIIIKILTYPEWSLISVLMYMNLFLLIFILTPITWARYFQFSHKYDNKNDKSPKKLLNLLYSLCRNISKNVLYRIMIYLIVCGLFTTYIFIDTFNFKTLEKNIVDVPWHVTEIYCLSMIMNFIFLRIHLWMKFIVGLITIIFYSCSIFLYYEKFYNTSESFNLILDPAISHVVSLIFLSFVLHLIDRQTEYMNKLDFQWKIKLTNEKEQANLMHSVNTILLENILPKHVAREYLNVQRKTGLYYEEYTNVAVMFASIVNYSLDDTDELYMKIMNRIISDFDHLLYKHVTIEKIKIANWTYMAACGLENDNKNIETEEENVVVSLLNFAIEMMSALIKLNKETQQNFELRIGISSGEVTAGVVGSKKPLYDIWGDTVNMASRMDSTGQPGTIQITEKSAKILKEEGIRCEYRGLIFVKGKSIDKPDVPTYFVSLKKTHSLVEYEKF